MSQQDTTLSQPATKADLVELKVELKDEIIGAINGALGELRSGLVQKIEAAVDTLARAVHTEFEETDRSLIAINVKLDSHTRQLHDLREDVGRVDIRLSRLQDTSDKNRLDIGNLDRRLVSVEQKVGLEPKPLRP